MGEVLTEPAMPSMPAADQPPKTATFSASAMWRAAPSRALRSESEAPRSMSSSSAREMEKSMRSSASGQSRHDALLDLFVELFPAFVGDGGLGAQQMVHRLTSFKLPIPRDPVSAAAGWSVTASASTSASISVMGSVVNRYVRRN